MTLRTWTTLAAALAATFTLAACGGSSSDAPPGPGDVFGDAINPGIDYQPFGGSDMTAHSVDAAEKHAGAASFRVLVPAAGYVGGTFVSATARDFSAFNAVTFWVKASKAATLNVAGFAVDNTPVTPFKSERGGIPVTTTWTKVVMPIPAPAKLTAEKGMFHFAEGSDEGAYTLWFDDIKYELLPAADLGAAAPAIATETRPLDVGATLAVNGSVTNYTLGGVAVSIVTGKRFFTWASSNNAVATVDADGVVTGVAAGQALITAKLGTVDAVGTTTVNVALPLAPATAAPTPAVTAANAIALFAPSIATTAVPGADWGTSWSNNGSGANLTTVPAGGNDVYRYGSVIYAGVDFGANKVDASGMTHFHVDVWSPNATKFGIKLVNFGTTTTEAIVAIHAGSTPAFAQGEWMSLDIPLTSFTGMGTDAIGQILWLDNDDGDLPDTGNELGTFFIDNVYFHK